MSNCVMIWFCEGDARRAPGMDLLTVGTPTWSTTPACLLLWSASSPESGWHAKKTCTPAADWSAKRRQCYHAIDSQGLCWKLPCQYWKRQPGDFLVSPDLKFNVIWQLVNLDKLPSKNSVKNRKETFFSAAAYTSSLALVDCLWWTLLYFGPHEVDEESCSHCWHDHITEENLVSSELFRIV